MKNNIRNKLTPQMVAYENLRHDWQPFLMYLHKPNFKSQFLNTDELGIRFTIKNQSHFSPNTPFKNLGEKVSLIVGGSTVFGVGATSDANTIPSYLSQSNKLFLNFGARAFSCHQERILFDQLAFKLPKIDEVIILSGLNDLYLNFLIKDKNYFGNFFYSNEYNLNMNKSLKNKEQFFIKKLVLNLIKKNKNYPENHQINNLLKENFQNRILYESFPNDQDQTTNNLNMVLLQIKKSLFTWGKLASAFPFKLKYILQPFPNWMGKEPTSEEKKLFNYLDKLSPNYSVLKLLTNDIYEYYSKGINKICNNYEIPFFDSNKILPNYIDQKDWIFVDRAHLTDKGNYKISEMISEILD